MRLRDRILLAFLFVLFVPVCFACLVLIAFGPPLLVIWLVGTLSIAPSAEAFGLLAIAVLIGWWLVLLRES